MTLTIARKDIVPLSVYRAWRAEYVRKMIAYKKDRRVQLSNYISVLFENRNTVLYQILELVHSEDLTDEAELEEYIDIYSGMLPGPGEWSATLFIEMDNQKLLEETLVKLKGIEHHLAIVVGNETIPAVFEEVHDDREFTTSVHYLKFPLPAKALAALREKNATGNRPTVQLVLSHPALTAEAILRPETVDSLVADLTD